MSMIDQPNPDVPFDEHPTLPDLKAIPFDAPAETAPQRVEDGFGIAVMLIAAVAGAVLALFV